MTRDITTVIPEVIKLINENKSGFEIGNYEGDEAYIWNQVCYDEDGWYIEVNFQCTGYWGYDPGDWYQPEDAWVERAWGEMEIEDLLVSHFDENDNETELSEEEIEPLFDAIIKELEEI